MATTAATGDLLQPSSPLTPVERMLSGAGGMGPGPGGEGMDCFGARHLRATFGCGTYLFGTYTAVPTASAVAEISAAAAAHPMIFYTAISFYAGKTNGKSPWVMLFEADLAPMVC